MTIPRLPTIGEEVSRGLQPLIQGLQFQQEQQQRQQQLELQQQQLEFQQLQQRQSARAQATNQTLALMRALGPDILEDPSVAQRLREGGLNPTTILRTFREQEKAERDLATAQEDALLEAIPQELRAGIRTSLNLIRSGLGREQAMQAGAAVNAGAIDPERFQAMVQEFPQLADLPRIEAIQAFSQIKIAEAQLEAGIGADARAAARLQLAQDRLDFDRERRGLSATDRNISLRSALAVIGLMERNTDPTGMVAAGKADLAFKPIEERIEALFGRTGLAAFRRAQTILFGAVAEQEEPPLIPAEQPEAEPEPSVMQMLFPGATVRPEPEQP